MGSEARLRQRRPGPRRDEGGADRGVVGVLAGAGGHRRGARRRAGRGGRRARPERRRRGRPGPDAADRRGAGLRRGRVGRRRRRSSVGSTARRPRRTTAGSRCASSATRGPSSRRVSSRRRGYGGVGTLRWPTVPARARSAPVWTPTRGCWRGRSGAFRWRRCEGRRPVGLSRRGGRCRRSLPQRRPLRNSAARGSGAHKGRPYGMAEGAGGLRWPAAVVGGPLISIFSRWEKRQDLPAATHTSGRRAGVLSEEWCSPFGGGVKGCPAPALSVSPSGERDGNGGRRNRCRWRMC